MVKAYPMDRWLDLGAERDSEKIRGSTSEPGNDADIAYRELLRRRSNRSDPDGSFALLVSSIDTCGRREPRQVREQLGIAVYLVDEHGQVS